MNEPFGRTQAAFEIVDEAEEGAADGMQIGIGGGDEFGAGHRDDPSL